MSQKAIKSRWIRVNWWGKRPDDFRKSLVFILYYNEPNQFTKFLWHYQKSTHIPVFSDQLLNALIFDTEDTLPRMFLTPKMLSWSRYYGYDWSSAKSKFNWKFMSDTVIHYGNNGATYVRIIKTCKVLRKSRTFHVKLDILRRNGNTSHWRLIVILSTCHKTHQKIPIGSFLNISLTCIMVIIGVTLRVK